MKMKEKSYRAIKKEIEELESKGYDEASIEAVLEAKYQESNIQRIRTEAHWEEENNEILGIDVIQKKMEKFTVISLSLFLIVLFIIIGVSNNNDSEQIKRTTSTSDGIVKDAEYWKNMEKFLNEVGTSLDPDKSEELWMERWGQYYGY